MAESETHHELELPRFDKQPRLLIVVAPFYRDIADGLIRGAEETLRAAGAQWEIVEVPGALELPVAIALAEKNASFDGYVALGCVIRGETTHYETVCNDSSRGLMQLGLNGACLGNGILTVETRAQAELRADPAGQNKGGGAAAAALHLIALARKWGRPAGDIGFKPPSGAFRVAGDGSAGDGERA